MTTPAITTLPAGAPLVAEPGRVVGLVGDAGLGLTRVGLSLLAEAAGNTTAAVVDVRGWMCPIAAWEAGIDPERLVTVRCLDRSQWPQVVATLVEGIGAVYAEVPSGIADAALRRLAALARSRRRVLLLRPVRGGLPSGVAHLRLQGEGVRWEGAVDGHGHLTARALRLTAVGKGVRGIEATIDVEDHGQDTVRLVPGLAAAPVRRPAG